jgi:hypothetical protein
MKKLIFFYFILIVSQIFSQSQQEIFETKRAEFKQQFLSAKNDIKRSSVFNNAANWSENFKDNLFNANDYWYGKIIDIRTDQGGTKAAIEIRSTKYGIQIDYETDNELFTVYDELIIKKGSKLYNQISDLEIDQYVKFKFNFIDGGNRGVFEKSITEEGSITEPEFVVKFITIEPIE